MTEVYVVVFRKRSVKDPKRNWITAVDVFVDQGKAEEARNDGKRNGYLANIFGPIEVEGADA